MMGPRSWGVGVVLAESAGPKRIVCLKVYLASVSANRTNHILCTPSNNVTLLPTRSGYHLRGLLSATHAKFVHARFMIHS